MALEVEKRFLVNVEKLPKEYDSIFHISQGYVTSPGSPFIVRARVSTGKYGRGLGFITLKNRVSLGVNKEFEYSIPLTDAEEIVSSCGSMVVNKIRYNFGRFEIDFFLDKLDGIVIAEIELENLDEEFKKPEWLGAEITHVAVLSNFNMVQDPGLAKATYKVLKEKDEFKSHQKTS